MKIDTYECDHCAMMIDRPGVECEIELVSIAPEKVVTHQMDFCDGECLGEYLTKKFRNRTEDHIIEIIIRNVSIN